MSLFDCESKFSFFSLALSYNEILCLYIQFESNSITFGVVKVIATRLTFSSDLRNSMYLFFKFKTWLTTKIYALPNIYNKSQYYIRKLLNRNENNVAKVYLWCMYTTTLNDFLPHCCFNSCMILLHGDFSKRYRFA